MIAMANASSSMWDAPSPTTTAHLDMYQNCSGSPTRPERKGRSRMGRSHGPRVELTHDLLDVAVIIVGRHRLISFVGDDKDDDHLEGAGQIPSIPLCDFEGHGA